MNAMIQKIKPDKPALYASLGATYLWGLLAHAYCFFDNNISHDSLNEFHAAIFGNDIKIGSGRIFVPLYRDLLRGDVTLPWLIGMLSLLWLALTVFLVVRIFRMESKGLIFLTAGIFTVNISVCATAATYIHDLDCNMFSLLLAVGAVYLWQERGWGWLPGALLLAISMGIYQSFLFTAITLVMMVCLLWLMDGRSFDEVFGKGIKAVGMVLLGGIAYYFLLKVSRGMTGITLSSGEYNSLDQMLELTPSLVVQLLGQCYRDFFWRLLNAYSSYPGILVKAATAVLLLIGAAAIGKALLTIRWKERLLLLVLTALLPLGMNGIYVLTLGKSHDLMVYTIWLSWLLVLLLSRWLREKGNARWRTWQKSICTFLTVVLLYGSVQFANGMYLKKDMEHDAYLSMMTRIADRMERYEGYVPGETPVVFVGTPQAMNYVAPGFKDYWNVTGMTSYDVIMAPEKSRFQAYFDYVLGIPVLLAEDGIWFYQIQCEESAAMPRYPANGCMRMVEGVLVIKLGDAV